MIDLHTHLLPAVDDGAATTEIALRTLRRFADDGVQLVACTPHLRASAVRRLATDAFDDEFAALQRLAPSAPALVRGWEVMLDEPGVDLTAPHLSLGGSSAVLVEFPRAGVPVQSARELLRLSMSGIVPVVAHPERYHGCTIELARAWRSAGAVLQVDSVMLIGDGRASRFAYALLAAGLVDILASDNHGDARRLAPVRALLEARGAREQADLLTRVNPERLLRNEPMLPVPPLPLEPPNGPVDRLRRWVADRVGSRTA